MVRRGQESAESAAAGPVGAVERAAVFHLGQLPAGPRGLGDAVAAAGGEGAGAEAAAQVSSADGEIDQLLGQDDYFLDRLTFQKGFHLVRAFGDGFQLDLRVCLINGRWEGKRPREP